MWRDAGIERKSRLYLIGLSVRTLEAFDMHDSHIASGPSYTCSMHTGIYLQEAKQYYGCCWKIAGRFLQAGRLTSCNDKTCLCTKCCTLYTLHLWQMSSWHCKLLLQVEHFEIFEMQTLWHRRVIDIGLISRSTPRNEPAEQSAQEALSCILTMLTHNADIRAIHSFLISQVWLIECKFCFLFVSFLFYAHKDLISDQGWLKKVENHVMHSAHSFSIATPIGHVKLYWSPWSPCHFRADTWGGGQWRCY